MTCDQGRLRLSRSTRELRQDARGRKRDGNARAGEEQCGQNEGGGTEHGTRGQTAPRRSSGRSDESQLKFPESALNVPAPPPPAPAVPAGETGGQETTRGPGAAALFFIMFLYCFTFRKDNVLIGGLR